MYIRRPKDCGLTTAMIDKIVEEICWWLFRYGPQTEAHMVNGFNQGIVRIVPGILEAMKEAGIIGDIILKEPYFQTDRQWYQNKLNGMWIGFIVDKRKNHGRCLE